MKSPTVSACWCLGVVAAGLAIAPDASACLQGYHRPVEQRTDFGVPVASLKSQMEGIKLEIPKFELLKIDGLAGGELVGNQEKIREELERQKHTKVVTEYEARPKGAEASFEDATNYAVALVHLGRSNRAIEVLLALEEKKPGVYTTAANLGTAYELTGNLHAALKWIQAGIERNADSHEGTEWLHVAILKAKIHLRADLAWLAKHSVLDGADKRDAAEIVKAIEYQLHERLQFVKPEDAVVCDLFYQGALRVSGEEAEKRRTHLLRESLRFGDWRKEEVERRLKS